MLLKKNSGAKMISIFTTLCFIVLVILRIFNIQHVSNFYFYIFIIMIYLVIVESASKRSCTNENEEDMNLFWIIIFIWDLMFVIYIFFNLGRYVVGNY